jgi:cytochrome c biogenesis protein CcdA
MKNFFQLLITFYLIFVSLSFVGAQGNNNTGEELFVFGSRTCHKCAKVKEELIPKIEKKFAGKVRIEYRDIDEMENYMFLLSLEEKYKAGVELDLPIFFFKGKFLNSKVDIEERLDEMLSSALGRVALEESISNVDLISRFKKFTPLAIISAGLIDGINPCAFTVLVFFISFLATQGYRKREILVIGLCFILAVFLTYVLLGIGLFSFLYKLAGFWAIRKAFNLCVGIFSVILGILAVYDFFKYRLNTKADGFVLQLPQAVKNRIHQVIGLKYRKTKDDQEADASLSRHLVKLVASALTTGFIVSILEAVCTGQTYLPTIAFILKTTPLKFAALGYLLLYNLMFILPLFLIFFFALFGVTSSQFGRFLRNNLLAIKLLMATLFFGLGIFLIWRA